MEIPRKKIRVQLTLTPQAITMLEDLAEDNGLSLSTMVEQLIRARVRQEAKSRATKE